MKGIQEDIEGLENLLEVLERGHGALVEASREVMSMSYVKPNDAILYKAHGDLNAIVKSLAHTKFMLKKLKNDFVIRN